MEKLIKYLLDRTGGEEVIELELKDDIQILEGRKKTKKFELENLEKDLQEKKELLKLLK